MKRNQIAKLAAFLAICAAAGSFLYSRMHIDYETHSQQSQQAAQEKQDWEAVAEFPETYKKQISENLTFDVDVILPKNFNPQNLYAASATIEYLDKEKAYDFFMKGGSNIQETLHDDQKDLEGNPDVLTEYEDSDGKYMAFKKESIYYTKNPEINYIRNSFYADKHVDSYNADTFSLNSDLAFLDREAAFTQLSNDMECIGLDSSTVNVIAVYSLDMENLKKGETCIDPDGNELPEEKNPGWSQADEGYYYYIGQQSQGLPLYDTFWVYNEEETPETAPLYIYQTQNGLWAFHLDHWFKIQKRDDLLQLVSFDKIMNTIEEKYSDIVKSDPLKVTRAKLYAFPVRTAPHTYSLTPVWICTLEAEAANTEGGFYTYYIQIPVNALTGEEMPELENNL